MKINGSARNDTLFGSAGSDLLAGKGGGEVAMEEIGKKPEVTVVVSRLMAE